MNNNYLTYLKWRGDLLVDEYPFNDTDNLILSELPYFDFNNIVSVGNQEISIKHAYNQLKMIHTKGKTAGLFSSSITTLEMIANSKRFGNMQLSHFLDIFDEKKIQFSALKIKINEQTNYISFKGTDDTLIGWKEDFSISFEIVPSQKESVNYLNNVIDVNKNNIVGGHSKGGNLAVYGSMMCEDIYKDSILKIYSNDGPGLCEELIDINKYNLIKHKIVKIVPEYSIVGLLFEDIENVIVVKSSASGILQHDIATWQVNVHELEHGVVTDQAVICKSILDEWMNEVELQNRKVFVDDFFKALSVNGAKTLTDLTYQRKSSFQDILSSMAFSHKKSKLVLLSLLKSTYNRFIHINYAKLMRTKEMIVPMLMFFLGLSFVVVPILAQKAIGTLVFIGLLIYSIFRLYKIKKQYDIDKMKVQFKFYFYGCIVIVVIFCIIQNTIIVFSTNMLLGMFLIYRGYIEIKRTILIKHAKKWNWILYFANAILLVLLGIVALTSSSEVFESYVLSVGSYLLIWGIVEIIKVLNNTALVGLKSKRVN